MNIFSLGSRSLSIVYFMSEGKGELVVSLYFGDDKSALHSIALETFSCTGLRKKHRDLQ